MFSTGSAPAHGHGGGGWIIALSLVSACGGTLESPSSRESTEAPPPVEDAADTGDDAAKACDGTKTGVSIPTRLLSSREYNNAIALLFPGIELPRQKFVLDGRVGAFVSNAQGNVVEAHIEEYRQAAEALSPALADSLDALMKCGPEQTDVECAHHYIEQLGRRVYRRALSPPERDGLLQLYDAGAAASHREGMLTVFEALLQSPSFIYVQESASTLSADEIAQRMSALLTRSIPDAELRAAADSGAILDAEERATQAERLLDTTQGQEAQVALALEWFGLDGLEQGQLAIDNPELVALFSRESELLARSVLIDGSGDLRKLLTARYTFANTALAEHYGYALDGAQEHGNGWFRITREESAGLLTQGSFLSQHTGSVRRGWRIRDVVLCSSVPGPDGVDTTQIENFVGESERSQAQKRLEHPTCSACHIAMDPLGLTLDNYDEEGIHRTEDEHGNGLSSEGEIIGTDVDGVVSHPSELVNRLVSSGQVMACLADNVFTWAYASQASSKSTCQRKGIEDALTNNEFSLRKALVDIATSESFAQGSGETQ
ncbi:MAG: DUF1592 domain-containing protein [Myxococcota bacterium]